MNAGNLWTSGASKDSLLLGLVQHLKVLIVALCRYANACGYLWGGK
jgi:hypothetical protein